MDIYTDCNTNSPKNNTLTINIGYYRGLKTTFTNEEGGNALDRLDELPDVIRTVYQVKNLAIAQP